MPTPLAIALITLAILGLTVRRFSAARAKRRSEELALERSGFRPCPEEKDRILQAVTGIENNREYRYDVKDLRKLEGIPSIHLYTKVRLKDTGVDIPFAEEEILFPLRRPSSDGVVLVVKPSAVSSGLATRLLGDVATAEWDAQPDDLERLDLPIDLENGNLLGALGPRGASVHDLVDSKTLAVFLGLGDAGAMHVRLRNGWCSIASIGRQLPFKMEQLVAWIRPLLG